jgi:hypothetical protein
VIDDETFEDKIEGSSEGRNVNKTNEAFKMVTKSTRSIQSFSGLFVSNVKDVLMKFEDFFFKLDCALIEGIRNLFEFYFLSQN